MFALWIGVGVARKGGGFQRIDAGVDVRVQAARGIKVPLSRYAAAILLSACPGGWQHVDMCEHGYLLRSQRKPVSLLNEMYVDRTLRAAECQGHYCR